MWPLYFLLSKILNVPEEEEVDVSDGGQEVLPCSHFVEVRQFLFHLFVVLVVFQESKPAVFGCVGGYRSHT